MKDSKCKYVTPTVLTYTAERVNQGENLYNAKLELKDVFGEDSNLIKSVQGTAKIILKEAFEGLEAYFSEVGLSINKIQLELGAIKPEDEIN